MSTIVTIQSSDLITNSRADINTNFSNLNTDKIETSYLDTDTTLAANSDSKLATQKAVKSYVDSGGNVNASETSKGIVEEATDAEVTAGTATGGTGAKLFVTPAKLATFVQSSSTAPVINVYTSTSSFLGDSTTQFDITNTAGTTYRYTWDGTGTDPGITTSNPATNAGVNLQAQNFSAGNKGSFVVTSSNTNYFEVTNASGVAENNKTIGTGYIAIGTKWTKPAGLKLVIVETVGGGGSGGAGGANTGGSGGGAGGYSKKRVLASALASVEVAVIGAALKLSGFGSHLLASAGGSGNGTNAGGSAGVGSSGDLNLQGQAGSAGLLASGSSGNNGGSSILGGGGLGGTGSGGSGSTGGNYGGGGGGASNNGGSGTNNNVGVGAQGVVIVTEYYA